jgi:hypothetical protein
MKKITLSFLFAVSICSVMNAQVYVDKTATGANDGTSWTDAYTNLTTAITNTGSGQIWVKAGTYFPGNPGQNMTTFLMKNNVEIYGGFNGTESAINQRDPGVNVTILSGDLDQSGTFNPADAFHVVTTGNTGSSALLDGFVISDGNAFGAGDNALGGGIYCKPPGPSGAFAPRIINCDIRHNKANSNGGGMYIECQGFSGGSSGPSIFNCKFHDNNAQSEGGAIFVVASGLSNYAIPNIENCLFFNNSAAGTGHHISAHCNSSGEVHPLVVGCTFAGNASGDELYYGASGINGTFDIRNSILYNQDLGSDDVFQVENSVVTSSAVVVGSGNASFDPLFKNPATFDFHLSCQSPAINNGSNAWVNVATELGGNPRTVGGTVDQGAYETNYTIPAVVANTTQSVVCGSQSITLTGSGAVFYMWDNGVSNGIPFIPSATTTYIVTGTDADGCTNTDALTINVYSLPGVIGNATLYSVCDGVSTTLTGSGAVSYIWTGGVTDGVPFTPLSTDTYTVTGTDVNGCMATSTLTVNVFPLPAVTANTTADPICEGASVTLTGSGDPATYTWDNSVIDGTPFNPAFTTLYTLTATDGNGCENTAGVTITVNPNPTMSPLSDLTLCETDSFALNANVSGGTFPYVYLWQDGVSNPISTANTDYFTPSATDTYFFQATDVNGCVVADNMVATVDASNTIGGTVYVGAGVELTDGNVYLIRFIPQDMVFDTIATYTLSASGAYSFPAAAFGNYLVKVIPDTLLFPTLLPTYYGDKFQWDSATVVTHNCAVDFSADINMIALLGGTGSGSISGFILEDVGFDTRWNGANHVMVPGGPLKGIDVKLGKNPAGGIQARTMSDSLGHYGFYDLPDDSYRIYVDIPGLPMDSFYVVNINSVTDTAINLNYYADSNSVYPILPTAVGLPTHKYTAANFDVFPNPAKNYTSIRFEVAGQHTATIRLLDITGKAIHTTRLNNLPKGKHEYQLNFADRELQSGIYFIEVQSGAGVKVNKLVVE